MRSKLISAVPLVSVLLLGGCTFIEKDIGSDLRLDAQTLLDSGQDLGVNEVLDTLGPPHQILALPDGYAFLYQKFDVRERQLGISSDAPVLRWLKFSLADAGSTSDTLVARFDRLDQLRAASVVTNEKQLGEAGSIMFVLNFLSQVDSTSLDQDVWGPGKWGMFMLQEPNVLLNAQSSPDTGKSTLDQRGSPVNVGQRTMDHRR